MKRLTIGILGLQGDIEEHISVTEKSLTQMGLNGEVIWVKKVKDVERLDGLIIPGGESTVIGRLADYGKVLKSVKKGYTKVCRFLELVQA